jgi:hypothetical protein
MHEPIVGLCWTIIFSSIIFFLIVALSTKKTGSKRCKRCDGTGYILKREDVSFKPEILLILAFLLLSAAFAIFILH